jgi:hypothetical protein
VAVTFRVGDAGAEYRFTVKDFPAVTMDVPAADNDTKEGAKA